MSVRALVSEADLQRFAKIAKEHNVRVEVEIDGKIIRVAPDNPALPSTKIQAYHDFDL
jgi:spore coat polysaccharide biosynthesis protein SpsF (cytidylyltransferase family)